LKKNYSTIKTNKILNYCCDDIFQFNLNGFSEAIHLRHLKLGKIPVSVTRFPNYLVRIEKNLENLNNNNNINNNNNNNNNNNKHNNNNNNVYNNHNNLICNPECFRVKLNIKKPVIEENHISYPFYSVPKWPDAIGLLFFFLIFFFIIVYYLLLCFLFVFFFF
jgi:hypothetical protein